MIGLGKMWKAVTGQGDEPMRPAGSTIPRDITVPRPSPIDPPWNPQESQSSETRTADRFVPHRTGIVLTTTGGKRIHGRIINISTIGVALEADLSDCRPDDIALVGSRPVVPGRRIALGMVFLFKKPLDPKLCGPDLVL